jgi:antitoxin (DNA-binding transcriptional repressor) of toxin-antitoxin stability system
MGNKDGETANGSSKRQPRTQIVTWHTMCHDVIYMSSVNIRELRDTRRLKAWLRAGKTVERRERDKLIARIVPEKEKMRGQWNIPISERAAKKSLGTAFCQLWKT